MPTQLTGAAREYTPPSGGTAGVIVLSHRSHSELKVPPAIADAVDLGRGSYCYSVGVDVFGDAIATALIPCGSGGVAAGPSATGSPASAPPVAAATASNSATNASASPITAIPPQGTSSLPLWSLLLVAVGIGALALILWAIRSRRTGP
jgi:hypothetical protein